MNLRLRIDGVADNNEKLSATPSPCHLAVLSGKGVYNIYKEVIVSGNPSFNFHLCL